MSETVLWSDRLHHSCGGYCIEVRHAERGGLVVGVDDAVVFARSGTGGHIDCLLYAESIVKRPERARRLYALHRPTPKAA